MSFHEWLAQKIKTAQETRQRGLDSLSPHQDPKERQYYIEGIAFNEGIEKVCLEIADQFPPRNFDLDFVSASMNCPN